MGCVYPGGSLERRVKELVIITASQTNKCPFCTDSHCDLVHISDIIDESPTRRRSRLGSDSESDATARPARGQRNAPSVGFINMLNLFNNLLGVRYNGEYSLLAPAAS